MEVAFLFVDTLHDSLGLKATQCRWKLNDTANLVRHKPDGVMFNPHYLQLNGAAYF